MAPFCKISKLCAVFDLSYLIGRKWSSFVSYLLILFQIPRVIESEGTKDFQSLRDFGTLHTLENLVHWANKEEVYIKLLRERLRFLNGERDILFKYKQRYEESSEMALKNTRSPVEKHGDVIGSSLILSHLMIDRYVHIVKNLRETLRSKAYRENRELMNKELRETREDEEEVSVMKFLSFAGILKYKKFPSVEDLYVSHNAILQTQEAFGFYSEQFSTGLEVDTKFGGVLRASHFAKLGAFALMSFPYYYQAVEWLEFGKTLIEIENDESVQIDILESLLTESIQAHNGAELRLIYDREFFTWINTYDTPIKQNQEAKDRLRGRHVYFQEYKNLSGNQSDPYSRYIGLCNGITFQSAEEKARLKCYLETKTHPFYILNPVKTEQLSEYPFVVKMYGVLGDEMIAKVKAVRSFGSLSDFGAGNNVFNALRHRSSVGFLDSTHEYDAKINKISEMLTGLKIHPDDEAVQLVEYVYGRYYGFHSDPISETEQESRVVGNRLATVVFYIEEPHFGGFTPFLQVGEYSESEKGSAVFWINAFRNGTIRPDVFHAACPVIHGNKMIINRWIGYNQNFQTFPCSLNPLD